MLKYFILLLFTLAPLAAQQPQPTVAELQQRIADLTARLEALEARLGPAPAPQPIPQPETPAPAPPPPADTETRLPVAGYMDFHLNKLRGDPFQPDFHRFVLLFGHSFSDRIKFWSELEVEHAIVEGG